MKTRLDCISSRVQTSWVKLSTAVSECVEYNKVKPEGCNPKIIFGKVSLRMNEDKCPSCYYVKERLCKKSKPFIKFLSY